MGAENPEAVLEDDQGGDGDSPVGMILGVGMILATIVVAGQILGFGVAIETYALVGTVLGLGGVLRFVEVLRS